MDHAESQKKKKKSGGIHRFLSDEGVHGFKDKVEDSFRGLAADLSSSLSLFPRVPPQSRDKICRATTQKKKKDYSKRLL